MYAHLGWIFLVTDAIEASHRAKEKKFFWAIHLRLSYPHAVCSGMAEYSKDLVEFEAMSPTDAACPDYLCQIRWPDGFRYPGFGGEPQRIGISLVEWIAREIFLR